MKLVYTHENRFLVANARNILQSRHIGVILKNEYASGALGEVAALDCWVELWVMLDEDYDRAVEILDQAMDNAGSAHWRCNSCQEENDSAFEVCWNCQTDQPALSSDCNR